MRGEIKLVYVGAITQERGLFNMLNLMQALGPRFSRTLGGEIGTQEDLSAAREHLGWKKTTYLGRLSRDQVDKAYIESDVGLILFELMIHIFTLLHTSFSCYSGTENL